MTTNNNSNSIPVPGLEQLIRLRILKTVRGFPQFETFLREDPNISRILDQEDGFYKYIVELLAVPDSWLYLNTILIYYLIWFFATSEFGIIALGALLQEIETQIKTGIKIDTQPLIDEIKIVDESIKQGFSELHNDIKGVPFGFETVVTSEFAALATALTSALAPIEISTAATAGTALTIEGTVAAIEETLVAELSLIRNGIDELPEKIAEALRLNQDELAEKIAKEVNKTIVGESYFKWSSTSQFYPSMTFVFAEPNAVQYPRRSQIKVRLKPLVEDFTEAMVADYRNRLNQQGVLTYEYGNFRCNYVSSDKRFKTTIYTSSRNEAVRILTAINFIIADNFVDSNLSITEGWRRPPLSRRLNPLGDNPAEQQNYQEIFSIQLVRVTIYLNGLKYPVDLLD